MLGTTAHRYEQLHSVTSNTPKIGAYVTSNMPFRYEQHAKTSQASPGPHDRYNSVLRQPIFQYMTYPLTQLGIVAEIDPTRQISMCQNPTVRGVRHLVLLVTELLVTVSAQ